MRKLAGDAAADGLLCSQAGIPVQATSKKFLDAYKAKYNVDPIIYAPFTYDAANLLIEAMKKANSADPAKYLPELQKISFGGATGPIAFDERGDRKDAEITIFTMKGGRLEPTAIMKGGKTIAYNEFLQMLASAISAAGDAAKAAVDSAAQAGRDAAKAAADPAKK
jgi:branched-chain amino acid transport system substrate-binding protein